jgi:hypothetical protein
LVYGVEITGVEIAGVETTEAPGAGFHGKVFIIDNLSVDLPGLRVNSPSSG